MAPRKNIIAISNEMYNTTSLFDKKNFIFIKNKEELNREKLEKINPEYIFFPHWSYIIPSDIYENFNCIIFHMSDLPFGRGGSPLQNLIQRGIYKTKISAIKCSPAIDSGDIYLKRDFDISRGSAFEIYQKAAKIVSDMIDEIIKTNPAPYPQKGEITEFKRRTPQQSDMGDLDDIKKIYDFIRMLDAPKYPKAYLNINNIKLEFSNAQLKNGKLTAKAEIKIKNE